MPRQAPSAKWLKELYGNNAEAVAGCYHRLFDLASNDASTVLEDLRNFCAIYDTTAHTVDGRVDPLTLAINEGRRQAYLHIVGVIQTPATDLKPATEGNEDGRDARRPADGPEPEPRYTGARSVTLDGPEPGAGGNPARDTTGGGTE